MIDGIGVDPGIPPEVINEIQSSLPSTPINIFSFRR
jgi:hypothetical protein